MFLMPEAFGRLRIWPTLEISAILLVVGSSTMGYQWNRGTQPTNRSQIIRRKLLPTQSISDILRVRQIQQQILLKINRSLPTPSIKDLPPVKPRPPTLAPANPNDIQLPFIILAKASDPYRPDTVHFRISSYIRSHIANVETALLIIRLRLSKKTRRALAERRRKLALKRKILEETYSACKNKTIQFKVPSTKNGDNSTEIVPLCRKGKKLKKKRNRKMKLRLKPRKIKLVVRLLDANKKRRLFAGEVLVKKLQIVRVPIPPKILKNAVESSNHTLTIQILCRKCRRKVLFDKVYRSSRKSRKNSTAKRLRKLNPNRPSLIIQLTNKAQTSESHPSKHRNKRNALNKYCSLPEHDLQANDNETDPEISDSDIECCAERKYITFEELGFGDWVIYPRGFTTVICLGSCGKESHGTIETGQNIYDNTVDDKTQTTPVSALQNKECIPLDSSHLDIIYFVNSNTIASGHLANSIDNSCGCAL